jgi:hypothetical protein
MSLNVMGQAIKAPVFVCENLNQCGIIGMNIIEKLGLAYNPKSRAFDFRVSALSALDCEPQTALLSTPTSLTLPALTVSVIKLTAHSFTGLPLAPNTTGIAVIGSTDYPYLTGGPGLVNTGTVGEVSVIINNCSPCDISLPRGTE